LKYCSKCGAQNADDAAFCSKCGTQLQSPQNTPVVNNYYYRRQRVRDRRESGQGQSGPHIGALIVAAIVIVAGLGIFYPDLPWQFFWGALLLMLGGLIAGAWALRRTRNTLNQPQPVPPQQ
jgi:protein-S-isoprenylcysteine O-methyltransferase Ste14